MKHGFTGKLYLAVATAGFCLFSSVSMACDIAVISAKASSTGRPMIWKSRDNSLSWQQEVFSYSRSDNTTNPAVGGSIRVVDTTHGGASPSGGVNEAGFAITNTTVYQTSPIHEYVANSNLRIMNHALEACKTVADFDKYLSTWNTLSENKHHVISGNFVAIDAVGGAALYEVTTGGDYKADRNAYGSRPKLHRIDANTGFVTNEDGALIGNDGQIGVVTDYVKNISVTQMRADRSLVNTGYHLSSDKKSILNSAGSVVDNGSRFCGFANHTNSSFWVDLHDDTPREDRAHDLMLQLKASGTLNHRTMMQVVAKDTDISQYNLASYPSLSNLDPGSATQQSTFHTISRYCTNLAFIVDGTPVGGNAKLTTMWINLGEPSVGVAIPFFPAANKISELMYTDTSYFNIFALGFVNGNFTPTCYINQAYANVRDTLYDDHTNITIPEAVLILLPNVPPDILAKFALWELLLDTMTTSQWNDYENSLIDWHVSFLAYMSQNDSADKTINTPGLANVQKWTMPLENTVYNQTEAFLNILRGDSSKITESNLSQFSDYATQFTYDNYTHNSANYKSWSFTYPWNVKPSKSLFQILFGWL